MDIETFQQLPPTEIARQVRETGPKVCVFTINGTRRWFMLEHTQSQEEMASAYFEVVSKRLIELCKLIFDHGIDTLLLPTFNSRLMTRSASYFKMMAEALFRLTDHARFRTFYQEYGVRIRFYGDHRQCFASTPYTHLSDLFDQLTAHTLTQDRHKLFFGVCAQDATETIATLAIRHYTEHGSAPNKHKLTEMYYGEYIPPADLFISSGKLHVSDIPLMTTGQEQLYFSVAPAPYLTRPQLRDILYDYIYTRRKEDANYETMTDEDWKMMHRFYQANLGKTLGVGSKKDEWGIWYPLPQVTLPEDFSDSSS